jgi:hypothetical protein
MRRSMQIAAISTTFALAGCAGWSTETKVEEAAYQALSAYDTVQSIHGANNPACYTESRWPTANVIGPHPSPSTALAWGVARSGLHLAVTALLEEQEAPRWVQRVWQGTNLAFEGRNVWQNQAIGLRFSSGAPPKDAPCLR